MMQGIRADGSIISPPYTYFTRLKKESRGFDSDKVNLYDSGDFQEEIFVDIGSDELEFDSMDNKSEELQRKYGNKILGLTDDSVKEYIDEAFPVFKRSIEDITKLEME